MKKILVVNVNWLGDVIFSSPVFRAIKKQYPNARVSVLALPRVRGILECMPGIDEIIEFDEKGKDRTFWARYRLAQRLKKEKFDAAFLLRPSKSRAMLLWAAGIPKRSGYAKNGEKAFLTDYIKPLGKNAHRCDEYLNVIESSGIAVNSRQTILNVDQNARTSVKDLLAQNGIKGESFIIINPGGNWDLKRWPIEYYIELIQNILDKTKNKIVLTGASKDKDLAEKISAQVKDKRLISCIGKTDIKELIALLEDALLVISGDSGPLHIASSVGTSVLGIYGPTRPEVTGVRGRGKIKILQKEIGCNTQACYFLDCPNNQCMQAVTAKEVFDAASKIIHK